MAPQECAFVRALGDEGLQAGELERAEDWGRALATLALNERPGRGDMNWRERFHAVWEAVMPRHLVVLLRLAALAALVACRERPTQQAQQTASAPPATAPADISHGEAPVGSSTEPPPVDPAAPPRSVGRLNTVRIEIRTVLSRPTDRGGAAGSTGGGSVLEPTGASPCEMSAGAVAGGAEAVCWACCVGRSRQATSAARAASLSRTTRWRGITASQTA